MTPSRISLILIACLGVVYLTVVLGSPRHAFWTIDGGFKFLTVEQLVKTSFRDVSIAYPGETIDEAGDFFPMKPPMATRVRDRFYPDVSLAFPILTAPLYKAFSWIGLYLFPLVATLLLLWLTHRLAAPLLGPWSPLSIPLLGLATPIFFYAVTFWEHNLAVLLTTAAVLVVARREGPISPRTAVVAGILLGLAIWFREECYLFAASAFLALVLTRSGIRAALGCLAGCAAAAIPLILFQWQVLGKPFGKRVQGATEYGLLPEEASTGVLGYLGDRLDTLYAWTVGLHQNLKVTMWVSVPLLVGLALFLVLGRRKNMLALAWTATAVHAVLCLAVLSGLEERVFSTYFSGGLFSTAPVLGALLLGALVATGQPRTRRETFMGVLVLIFFSLAVLLSPVKYQRGVHWGPRYLLPVFPIVTVIGLAGVRRAVQGLKCRSVLALGVLILALSFVVQTHGIADLQIKKRGTARTIALLRKGISRDVVTNVWWFPVEVAAAYREHRMFGVTDTRDFHDLLDAFARSGIDRFVIIASPVDDRILRDPAISVKRVQPLMNPSMSYFDLLFCECTLSATLDSEDQEY